MASLDPSHQGLKSEGPADERRNQFAGPADEAEAPEELDRVRCQQIDLLEVAACRVEQQMLDQPRCKTEASTLASRNSSFTVVAWVRVGSPSRTETSGAMGQIDVGSLKDYITRSLEGGRAWAQGVRS